jgi:hypothetical protein
MPMEKSDNIKGDDEQMKIIRKYKNHDLKIHIEADNYNVTDDNGVDIWLTQEQVNRIAAYEEYSLSGAQ